MSIPHSTYQRSIDLAGEIKCALNLVAECEQAEAVKAAELSSAQANTTKQRDNLARLIEERRALAEQAHREVMSAGEDYAVTLDFGLPNGKSVGVADSELPQF